MGVKAIFTVGGDEIFFDIFSFFTKFWRIFLQFLLFCLKFEIFMGVPPTVNHYSAPRLNDPHVNGHPA